MSCLTRLALVVTSPLRVPARYKALWILTSAAHVSAVLQYGHERDPERYPPVVVIVDNHPTPGGSNLYHEQPPEPTTDVAALVAQLGETALALEGNAFMEFAFACWIYDSDWITDGTVERASGAPEPIEFHHLHSLVEAGAVRNWYRSYRPTRNRPQLTGVDLHFMLSSDSDEEEEDLEPGPYRKRPFSPGGSSLIGPWGHGQSSGSQPGPSADTGVGNVMAATALHVSALA